MIRIHSDDSELRGLVTRVQRLVCRKRPLVFVTPIDLWLLNNWKRQPPFYMVGNHGDAHAWFGHARYL